MVCGTTRMTSGALPDQKSAEPGYVVDPHRLLCPRHGDGGRRGCPAVPKVPADGVVWVEALWGSYFWRRGCTRSACRRWSSSNGMNWPEGAEHCRWLVGCRYRMGRSTGQRVATSRPTPEHIPEARPACGLLADLQVVELEVDVETEPQSME